MSDMTAPDVSGPTDEYREEALTSYIAAILWAEVLLCEYCAESGSRRSGCPMAGDWHCGHAYEETIDAGDIETPRDVIGTDLFDFMIDQWSAIVALGLDGATVGHDFYLSRQGSGAGFWDRGWGDLGDELHRAAKVYGECYIDLDPATGRATYTD